MVRLLDDRAAAGVDIRVLGKFRKGTVDIPAHPLVQPRLHARVIVRDGKQVFIGSQSLKAIELDGRREVGLIVRNRRSARASPEFSIVTGRRCRNFRQPRKKFPARNWLRRWRKPSYANSRRWPRWWRASPREISGRKADLVIDADALEETVRDAVRSAVKDVIEEVALSAAMVQFS